MAPLSGSALSVESQNIRSLERLELRSMLDRDGRIPSSKRFCSGCETAHDSSLFPISSLAQLSTERRCLGTAGRVWICPHQTVDYDQAANPEGAIGNSQNCETIIVSSIRSYWTIYRPVRFSYRISYPIVIVRGEGVPSKKEVNEALSPLNAPMCPHLGLNDARVARSYLPDCQRLRCRLIDPSPLPHCGCWICSSEPRFRKVCDFCDIDLHFNIRSTAATGIEALYLIVGRRIRTGRSPTDPSWICQVADPADFEAYERA